MMHCHAFSRRVCLSDLHHLYTMGYRQAAVLASVSFLAGPWLNRVLQTTSNFALGTLFLCLNVDYRLLWALDDQAVKDGFVFYTTFYHAPPAIRVGSQPRFSHSSRLCLHLRLTRPCCTP